MPVGYHRLSQHLPVWRECKPSSAMYKLRNRESRDALPRYLGFQPAQSLSRAPGTTGIKPYATICSHLTVSPFKAPCLHLASPIRGDINSGRRISFGGAKLETGHAGCNVQTGLRLDTERLQGNGLLGATDQ